MNLFRFVSRNYLLVAKTVVIFQVLLSGTFSLASEGPNFVFILTDDQGWTGMSASMLSEQNVGSDYYLTPNMTRLAQSGMRFSRGYAPAALCCPSRRSLQFGQSPLRMGDDRQFAERYPIDSQRLTIPRLLKSIDPRYAAAHYGKWDMRTPLAPEHLGYDEGDGVTGNGNGSEGDNGAPDPVAKDEKWSGHAELEDPKRIFSITARATDFMQRMSAEKRPFYVQLSHYAVHADMQMRAETLAKTKPRHKGEIHANPFYAAMTEDLDAGIGLLLAKLDELKLRENTYIIFMADNGGVPWIPPDRVKNFSNPTTLADKGANYPLRAGKWTVFEGGVRVPFMVSGPGIPPGTFSNVPVIGWDILPTIADLAGYQKALPADIDGASFRSVLENNGVGRIPRPNDFLIFHRFSNAYRHTAIQQDDFKLIRFWKRDVPGVAIKELQLYNLRDDIGETQNLAANMPEKVRELERQMSDYLRSVDFDVHAASDSSDE
ncbi:MAG: sulfatase [Planctomycetaceae bacterium]|nr:sulfatase [Planctomycetaceae bacterium]